MNCWVTHSLWQLPEPPVKLRITHSSLPFPRLLKEPIYREKANH
jgi:hypothetical protein